MLAHGQDRDATVLVGERILRHGRVGRRLPTGLFELLLSRKAGAKHAVDEAAKRAGEGMKGRLRNFKSSRLTTKNPARFRTATSATIKS